jgi:hypothetical protein
MKVEKINLGNGLYRLDIVPTSCCEDVKNVPSWVKDKMVQDFIKREKNVCMTSTSHPNTLGNANLRCGRYTTPLNTSLEPKRRSYAELRRLENTREPDGIDIHVDRPLKENFPSTHDWALAMAKYRTLEDVAKDCDWECREPMKGTEFYNGIPQKEEIFPRFFNLEDDIIDDLEEWNDVTEDNWCPCRWW